MTYEPATYWTERHRRYGDTYVAEGVHYRRQLELGELVLRGHLPTSGRVLDFGCGTERFRPVLEAHGLTYDGLDIIPGLGTTSRPEPGTYAAAIVLWVLQHIVAFDEYRRTVGLLHEALMPGGTLVVIDHNPEEDMNEHMHPRASTVLELLYTTNRVARFDDRHWYGVFRK